MKKYQKDNSKNWGRNKKLLFGASDDDDGGDNEFAFGWGLVKSLETAIYVQNPEMAAEPYSGKLMETGHLLTNIANYDIDQMNLKAIGNLGLIDNFICGFFACIEPSRRTRSPSRTATRRRSSPEISGFRLTGSPRKAS